MSIVFNGRAYAKQEEVALNIRVNSLRSRGVTAYVKSFTFTDDEGSRLYTRLKKTAAEKIGIVYEPVECRISDEVDSLVRAIQEASHDERVTGVMVQKPAKKTFQMVNDKHPIINDNTLDIWWGKLTSAIDPKKDVDCLTKENLSRIKKHTPFVIPATVRAVLSILAEAKQALNISDHTWKSMSVAIIGRSDIVGKPLSWILQKKYKKVDMFGRANMPRDFFPYDIVISAVGRENLVTGLALKRGSIVIDVGSPKGDIEFASAVEKTSFLTPVPGGVGPVTVVRLMQNVVELSEMVNVKEKV